MIVRLQLSDTHLGDPRSTLSNLEVAAAVVDQVAKLSGGEVGRLVLAGDVHEECVPGNLGDLHDGVNMSVLAASVRFLGDLFRNVRVGEVVVVPGNHDLSTWYWYCKKRGLPVVTPYDGVEVDPSDWPWKHLYPGAGKLRFAYPLYWDRSVGDDYPALLTTHGHLLDPLVLGWDQERSYAALSVLGCRRPGGIYPSTPVDVDDLARKTLAFVTSLWARYSERDYAYANYVMRRLAHPQTCAYQGMMDGVWNLSSRDYVKNFPGADLPPSAQDYVLGNLQWFLSGVLMDPKLPTPVGSLRQGDPSPAALTKRSCLTRGHDHLGTFRTVVACGVPFVDVSSGGWTSEFDGHLPHAHSLVWKDPGQVVPEVYFHRARTRDGRLL